MTESEFHVPRPHLHFTPPDGWMNDPNGLVWYEGEYHLFYQYRSPRHWGHAVSIDLVQWEHLPIAFSPDVLGDIWSGSVVVDAHDTSGFFAGGAGLVALFTHQNANGPPDGPQSQSLAWSSDRGRTWTKYAGNPVLPNPGVVGFRDPKVLWHEPTARWVMVLAYNDEGVRFYTSANLREWDYASDFGVGPKPKHSAWECPDLFPLPLDGDAQQTKWILHVSCYYHAQLVTDYPSMQYFVGAFDGSTFIPDHATPHSQPTREVMEQEAVSRPAPEGQWTDYGPDHYAAVSWSNIPATDGRRLWLGWMANWAYATQLPTTPWQGMMTLPRCLALTTFHGTPQLTQQPIAELQRWRGAAQHWTQEHVQARHTLLAPGKMESTVEIRASFQAETAHEFGVRVRVGTHDGHEQFTTIGYDVPSSRLFVDRTHSGATAFASGFAGRSGGPMALRDGLLDLHIIIDTCAVEVFGNDGETVISTLIFPDMTSTGIEVYALGGTVLLQSLAVYPLTTPNQTP